MNAEDTTILFDEFSKGLEYIYFIILAMTLMMS